MPEEMQSAVEKPRMRSGKDEDMLSPDLAAQINNISRSVKLMEEKYSNLRKKVQINDENSLAQTKKSGDEIRVINSNIMEIRRDVEDIKEKIRLIVRELKITAKEEDIKVVQKYLDLWEPAEFITRNEAKKMIERAVEEKFK